MKLYTQTLLMALCVVCAVCMPSVVLDNGDEDIDSIYSLLLAQVRTAVIDTRALTPAEQACANLYNNATTQINNNIANQTNTCFLNANSTSNTNEQNANVTITAIRAHLNAVQTQLANCTAMQGSSEFLNCTTANFDSNLRHLDEANSQAYLVQAQISTNANNVNMIRDACVSAVISTAKTNLTVAANDYTTCLHNIKNQRYSPMLLH